MAENTQDGLEDNLHGGATEVRLQLEGDGPQTTGEETAISTVGISPDAPATVAAEGSTTTCGKSRSSVSSPTLQRDERGKFKPKPNPEFTLSHFWLEVMEIAIGILIAQTIWEGGVWIMK